MRIAEIEVVTYDTPAMIDASVDFAKTYSANLGEDWTTHAADFIHGITKGIKSQSPLPILWSTPGFQVGFSGFPPVEPFLEEGKTLYTAPTPHLVLKEDLEAQIPSSTRIHLMRVTAAIADKMVAERHMEAITNGPLLIMNFPKERYSSKIEIVRSIVM